MLTVFRYHREPNSIYSNRPTDGAYHQQWPRVVQNVLCFLFCVGARLSTLLCIWCVSKSEIDVSIHRTCSFELQTSLIQSDVVDPSCRWHVRAWPFVSCRSPDQWSAAWRSRDRTQASHRSRLTWLIRIASEHGHFEIRPTRYACCCVVADHSERRVVDPTVWFDHLV